MFGSTALLTVVTLAGLVAGFAREWLLITSWGAGSRTDAFLTAMFLTEMLRTTMAAGLLSAAALPLYQRRNAAQRKEWLDAMLPQGALAGVGLSVSLALLAPWLVRLLAPGLDEAMQTEAVRQMRLLVWCIPGIALHALLCIAPQASSQFSLAGTGSLMFNLPQVFCLVWSGERLEESTLALSALAGSILMTLVLLPSALRAGWSPFQWRLSGRERTELARQLGPLLASSGASNAITLLERTIASLLGDGVLTWLNFARKLINLPLIALASLNQVMLGLMSQRNSGDAQHLLRQALNAATVLTLPTSIGLIGAAPTLVLWLGPKDTNSALALLVAWLSTPLLLGSWNALLARYSYANGNTHLPLSCELLGNLVNALALCSLPFLLGLPGIAMATLLGTASTGLSLLLRLQLLARMPWWRVWSLGWILQGLAAHFIYTLPTGWKQVTLSVALSLAVTAATAFIFRPWRLQTQSSNPDNG